MATSQKLTRRTVTLGAFAAFLAGTRSADAQRGGNWELLGQREVSLVVDRDVVPVGRQDGRFRAIQLRVRGNDINFLDLKVVYGNGEVDDIPIRALIREGTGTRVIDLPGNRRFIREVAMTYRRRVNFRGKAVVEVWGVR